MIETAAILSLLVQKWEDFTIIMVLLITNVVIDFLQESRALSALQVLKNKLVKTSLVLRDGKFQKILTADLVPGDIIKIKIGDMIPADVKLIAGEYLMVDQSALTGESLPVDKMVGDIGYANAIVKMGEMIAVVTQTANDTYFGKTVALVAKAQQEQKSHFQKAILSIGNYLIIITGILIVIIIITAMFRGDSLPEILRFCLVLTIASIPVAMPAVLSVSMAVGAMNLAKRQVIVSRLAAIEELAGMDILCSDKTGTLTKNTMSMTVVKPFNDYSEEELIKYALLSSQKNNQDPLETPIFDYPSSSEIIEGYKKDYKLLKFIPFDPVNKRTEAVYVFEDENIVVTKGAPQVILELCSCDDSQKLTQSVEEFAQKGYRTLGVAMKKQDEVKFHFVGLLPLFDPPREDAKTTIEDVRKYGIDIKMVTGDNLSIAKQISQLLLIGPNILDNKEIKHNTQRPESEILGIIEKADGFAQVLPEDKYNIVDKLQKANHIVAMTGDGVNDAPALKKADVGIVVSGATDAARAAGDIILLAPGLNVIINAVKEARMTFARMQSYSIFRIAETIRIILFMALAILILDFYPITAIMIIILALLNDIPIMAIAFDNVNFGKARGLAVPFMVPMQIVAAPLSGWLYDTYGNYTLAFSINVVLCIIAGFVVMLLNLPDRRLKTVS